MFFGKPTTAMLLPFRGPKSPPQIVRDHLPLAQTAPIFTLPVELLQEITSYLKPASAASFSLSARYIYYVLGSGHLATYLQYHGTKYTQGTKIQRRKNIEILERAFPSHWYCAWCDRFHVLHKDGGPKASGKEARRECAKSNSYLHAGSNYVLRYHHVRLAVNYALWGEEYGIPLDAFQYYNGVGRAKVMKREVSTALWCEAKINSGRLILHATFKMWVPLVVMRNPEWLAALWPTIPQIVVGHRDSHHGHSGLKSALGDGNFLNRVQLCSLCATDYRVHKQDVKGSDGEQIAMLTIEAWRDLGNGRSPFDASWRAHGDIGGAAPGFGGDMVRLTGFQAGDIRNAFQVDTLVEKTKETERIISPSGYHQRDERTEMLLSGTLSLAQEIIQSRSARGGELVERQSGDSRNIDALRRQGVNGYARSNGGVYMQRAVSNGVRHMAYALGRVH